MYFSNIHTHTCYCDGNDTVEQMVVKGIDCGLKTIGISTHGPLPFKAKWAVDDDKIQNYIDDVNYCKEKYKDKIEVLLGMELDYFVDTEFGHIDKDIVDKLDYWIGSIHYLGRYEDGTPWTVDSSSEKFINGIKYSYNGDEKRALTDYFDNLGKMTIKYRPTIVGHLDLVRKTNKNNVIFDENADWYKKAVLNCLDSIAKTDSIMEINTGGIARGYLEEQYPANWVLKEANDRDIPIIINSDAHNTNNLVYAFDEMYELAKQLKIKNLVYLTKEGPKKINY